MADIRIIPALGAINVTGSADFRGTGASSVLFVSGSGNVGIGTADPGSKLHIQGAVKATATTGHVFGTSTDTSRALSILNSNLADASSHAITLGYGASNNNQAELSFYLVGTGSASNRLSLGLYNSSDTLNILGNGSVGIGTTAPKQKLDVAGAGGKIAITNTGTSNYSEVVFYEGSTVKADIWVNGSTQTDYAGANSMNIWQGSNAPMAFYTNGTNERMRIAADGKVGIGTTPYAPVHIKVAGTPPASGQQGLYGNLVLEGDADKWNRLRFDTAGTGSWGVAVNTSRQFAISRLDSSFSGTPDDDNFVIDTTGNIGIGLNTPGAKLDINSGISTSSTDVIKLTQATNGADKAAASLGLSIQNGGAATNAADLWFTTANNGTLVERLRISSTGAIKFNNYGSGTNTGTAAYRLSVDSSGNIIEESLGAGAVDGLGSSNYLARWEDTDTLTSSSIYETGGSIGIGLTNPTAKLDVYKSGSLVFNVVGSQGQLFSVVDSLSGSLMSVNDISGVPILEVFSDDRVVAGEFGTNALVVTGSSVGVGTSSPESKFTVDNGHLTIKNGGVLYVENPGGGRYGYLTTNASGTALSSYDGSNEPLLLQAPQSGAFINLKVGTTDIMRLIGGKVGIGTTNPATKLHVISDQSSAGTLRLQNTSNTGYSNIQFYSASGAFMTSFGYINKGVNNIGGTTLLDLDSGDPLVIRGGSVGIGLTNPSYQLDVTAASQHVVRFTSTTADNGGLIINKSNASYNPNILLQAGGSTKWYILSDSNDSDKFKLYEATGTSPRFTLTQGGNVGINTTAPGAKLDVRGDVSLGVMTGYQQTGVIKITREDGTDRSHRLVAYNTNVAADNYLRFDIHDGNVSSYQTALTLRGDGSADFAGDINVDGIITAKEFHTTFVSASIIYQSGSTQFGNSYDDTHVFTGSFTIDGGTTGNTAKLTIAGNDSIIKLGSNLQGGPHGLQFDYEGGKGDGMSMYYRTTPQQIVFENSTGTGGTAVMAISRSGDIGIGTTNPAVKLQVESGGIRATGTTSTTGQIDASPAYGAFRFYDGSTFLGGLGTGQWAGVGGTGDSVMYLATNRAFHVSNTTTPRLTVSSTGNVGIGTTAPARPLHIYGNDTGTVDALAQNLSSGSNAYTAFRLQSDFGHTYLPGLFLNSSTNTAYAGEDQLMVYQYHSKPISLVTSNLPRLTVTGGGDIGIGLTNPSKKLHIQSSAKDTLFYLQSTNTTADGYAQIQMQAGSRSAYFWVANQNATSWGGDGSLNIYTTNGAITWWPGQNQKMILTTGGNLGIGTDSPTTKLDVDYDATLTYDPAANQPVAVVANRNNSNVNNQVATLGLHATGWQGSTTGVINLNAIQSAGNASTADFSIQTRNGGTYAEKVRLTAAGNMGIGVSAPTAKLHTGPGNWASSIANKNYSGAAINTSGSDIATGRVLFQGYNEGGSQVIGINNETNRLVLYNYTGSRYLQIWDHAGSSYLAPDAGNVGIGTSSSSRKLTVYSTENSQYSTYIYHGGATGNSYGLLIDAGTNATDAALRVRSKAGDDYFEVQGDGNVGIATTSSTAYLQVGTPGSTLTKDLLLVKGGGGSGNYGFRVQANNADELFLVDTYTYNTTIPYAGEVYGKLGVGTTAPQAKLHVAGTTLFEKGITVETNPAVHSGSNWYSLTDSHNIVRITDGRELYIEKESGAAGYSYFVVSPEEVGLNFDISFRLSGGVPTSYRHLGIAIANDGSNTVANFDYIVFRNNPSLSSNNQIRIDVAGSTENSLVNASVPDFFDGTERDVLIQVRNNKYVVEIDGVVEHDFNASARTNSRGLVGFAIYEAAAADTWIKIRDFAITQYSDDRTILAGNVGIGLRNPAELLHIYGGASGYGSNVRIDSTNEYGGLSIFEAGNLRGTVAYGNAGNILTGAGSNSLSIRSENALHLAGSGDSLTATVVSGKVGIGTTSPLTKLHISSVSVNPAAAAIQGDSKLVVSGVDGNIDLFSQDDNSTVSNAIGMGRYNASTGALIHKFGLVSWAETGNQGSNAGNRIAFHYGTGADTWGNTELMSIAATGNVGIGSTVPGYKLDVSAAARVHGVRMGRDFSISNRATVRLDSYGDEPADILFGQSTAADQTSWNGVYWGISSRDSGTASHQGNKFTIWRAAAHASPNNSENQFLTITPDLKMGIANTAPNYPLDVTGKIYSSTEVQGGTAFIKDTSGISVFGSNTSTRSIRVGRDGTANDIFITGSNGDVGIGISTPSYKLHVNGDLKAAGITSTDSISVIHSAGYGFYSGPGSFQSFGSGVSTILLQGTTSNGRAGALWFKGYQGDDVASLYVTDDTQDNYGTTLAAYSGSIRFATQTLAGAKMTITPAGDVGIGTGSPIGKLQIGGTSGNLLTVGTLTNNWAGEVAIGVTNGNGVIISKVNTANDTNRVLVFYRDDTNGASIFGYTPSGGSTDIGFQIRSNNTSYFNGGGVGIGTSSPAARLHVVDGSSVTAFKLKGTNAATYATFGDTSTTSYSGMTYETNAGNGQIWHAGNSYSTSWGGPTSLNIYNSIGHIAFHPANSANAMTIASSTNVGIGSTAPGYKLDVNGGIRLNAKSALTDNAYFIGAPTYGFRWNNNADTFNNVIMYDNGNMYVRGSVGIGTTNPAVKLVVAGTIRATGTLSQIDTSPTHGAFRFYDGSIFYGGLGTGQWSSVGATSDIVQYLSSGVNYHVSNTTTPVLTVSSGGNVGIGTTTPAAKLHVVGDIMRRGALLTPGSIQVGTNNYSLLYHWTVDEGAIGTNTQVRTNTNPYGSESIKAMGRSTSLSSGAASIVIPNNRKYRKIYGYFRLRGQGSMDGWVNSSAAISNDQFMDGVAITGFDSAGSNETWLWGILVANYNGAENVANKPSFVGDNYQKWLTSHGINGTSYWDYWDNYNDNSGNTPVKAFYFEREISSDLDGDIEIRIMSDQSSANNEDVGIEEFAIYVAPENETDFDDVTQTGIGTRNPAAKLDVYQSGSLVFNVAGSQGQLFSVTDSLSGSLMSVNDISGVPILEVFSDDRVVAGEFGTNALVVTGSRVGVGTDTPGSSLEAVIPAGGQQVFRVRNHATAAGSFTNNYVAEIRSAYTTAATAGALLVHTQEASDARPTMAVSDSNGVFTTFVNGKVGIGSTAPNTKLNVVHTNLSAEPYTGITVKNTSTTGAAYTGLAIDSQFQSHTRYMLGGSLKWQTRVGRGNGTDAFDIYSWTAGKDVFSVISNGNIGINDTSPSYQLDVNGTIRATGDVIAYSDRRVKQDIVTLENSVDLVKKLRGVSYKKIGEDDQKIGVIAQEILEVLPQVVSKDTEGMYSVAYGNMAGLFIEAIKEQQHHIESLEDRIQKLEQLLTQKP